MDVDECVGTAPNHSSPCQANEFCSNTFGSYTCSCRCGYRATSTNPGSRTSNPVCVLDTTQICFPDTSLSAWYTFDGTLANQQVALTTALGDFKDSRAVLVRDVAQNSALPVYSVGSVLGKALRVSDSRVRLPSLMMRDFANQVGAARTTTLSFNFKQKAPPCCQGEATLFWLQSSGGTIVRVFVDSTGVIALSRQASVTRVVAVARFPPSKRVRVLRWYQMTIQLNSTHIAAWFDHPLTAVALNEPLEFNQHGDQTSVLGGNDGQPRAPFDGWLDNVRQYSASVGFTIRERTKLFRLNPSEVCFLKDSCRYAISVFAFHQRQRDLHVIIYTSRSMCWGFEVNCTRTHIFKAQGVDPVGRSGWLYAHIRAYSNLNCTQASPSV